MRTLNLWSAVRAGIVGTVAMTLLMYAAPLMGLPEMDLLFALGSMVPLGLSPYVVGAVMHLGVGAVLAVLYAAIFERIIPGPRLARGGAFALLPWLFAITLMGPAMAWMQAVVARAEAASVVNPCAAANPCSVRPASKPANPCAAANPCAVAPRPANPCAAVGGETAGAPSPWLVRMMSLVAHLLYGGVVAGLYRRRDG